MGPESMNCFFKGNILCNFASEIEKILYETDLSIESLKTDNHYYINAFSQAGEKVTLIDRDFEDTMEKLLNLAQ